MAEGTGVAGAAEQGAAIVRASFAGTGALAVASAAGVADPDTLGVVSAAVAVGLFAAGSVTFLWAYGIAVNRSRTDAIGIGGLYFLAGSAPAPVRLRLLGSFVAQVVVAVVAASLRPYTNLAFGILAPVYGLALCGLWAARYGSFGPRAGRQSRAGQVAAPPSASSSPASSSTPPPSSSSSQPTSSRPTSSRPASSPAAPRPGARAPRYGRRRGH